MYPAEARKETLQRSKSEGFQDVWILPALHRAMAYPLGMPSASATKRKRPNLNPEMLAWARKWRGRTLEEAARRVQKTPADIEAWEDTTKEERPTVRQARQLADLYERSFLEFFRTTPPPLAESALVPDYRLQRGAIPDPTELRELKAIQEWAEEKRTNALDLYAELGEEPPAIPEGLIYSDALVPATGRKDPPGPERAAENARSILNFRFQDQIALSSADRTKFPSIIRAKLEAVGILTLRRSDLHRYRARGICIVASPLPVIVFGNESPGAQSFTLAHELAHIVRQQSGISGDRRRETLGIERWCDEFAAAFLMPRAAIERSRGPKPNRPAQNISDEALNGIATFFRVSPHAMLIRLVNLGYVAEDYYWAVKKSQFDKAEEEYEQHGRSPYYGRRYETSVGDLYTGLVLETWNSGRITNHNAAEFMGIKNFEHLFDIRDNFKK